MKRILAITLLLTTICCSTTKDKDKQNLILLGLDGFNWHVAYPMIKQGLLPNMEKLMEKGMASEFKTYIPTVSPILWTSLATGKTPQKHQIFWRVMSNKRDDPAVKFSFSSEERTCKAFWNILSDYNRSVDVIDWWCSWPAEKINGYDVTFSYMQYDEMKDSISPPEFLKELNDQKFDIGVPKEMSHWIKNAQKYLPEIPKDVKFESWEKRKAGNNTPTEKDVLQLISERFKVVKDVSVQDNKVRTISEYILKSKRVPDVFAVYYWYPDLIQHHYWKYMEPEFFSVNPEEMKIFQGVVPAYYRYMDGTLEGMIDRMNSKSHVIVCSDHALYPSPREKQVSENLDVMLIVNLMDIVKKYPDVKVNIHDSIRILRTFDIKFPDNYSQNQKDDFKKKFTDELKAIKGIKTKVPLFSNVYLLKKGEMALPFKEGKEIYLIDPADVALVINYSMDIEETISIGNEKIPIKKYTPYTPQPSANHPDAPDGFFLAYGPSFESGVPPQKPEILNITPTMLYLLDLPVADDMDGSIFLPLFKEEFKKTHQVKRIKTFEDATKKDKKEPMKMDHKGKLLDQLKSLGYI
jgi:predicted AlkP superfamily phosphohydrolase/phosphomutase